MNIVSGVIIGAALGVLLGRAIGYLIDQWQHRRRK